MYVLFAVRCCFFYLVSLPSLGAACMVGSGVTGCFSDMITDLEQPLQSLDF